MSEHQPTSEHDATPQFAILPSSALDAAAIRKRLEGRTGRDYWRCLDEIAETPGFEDFLHREFPRQASEWHNGEGDGRRDFLKLMGASLALAGLGACTRQPTEYMMPYVNQPEHDYPGKPLFFASAITQGGYATGVLVESNDGRPTKIEGNPQHPASLGSTDAFTQGAVLNVYDPDRSQAIGFLGEIRSYSSFLSGFKDIVAEQLGKQGAGLRILTETITSPSLTAQMKDLLSQYPSAKWIQWDPVGLGRRQGTMLAFGSYANPVYKFDQANVVLSLDADFLIVGPGAVRYSRDFMAKRRVRDANGAMNRLYAVECTPTSTGVKADHRWPLKPSEIEPFARELAGAVGGPSAGTSTWSGQPWFIAMVKDLQANRGAGIVIAGENQSAEVHALAFAINESLGNLGKTVTFTEPVEGSPDDQLANLKSLCADLDSGSVDVLMIVGGNPVFNTPVDLDFAKKLQKARLRIRLGLYDDETSQYCQWQIPQAHELEMWGDVRAFDGTVTLVQPLIVPLYGGKSPAELLAALTETPEKSGYDALRDYWQKQHTGTDFEAWWRRSVHDGVVADSALPSKAMTGAKVPPSSSRASGGADTFEVSFYPDPYIYDGRYANNGWLQELPRPMSKLTWDNAALMSIATAERLKLWSESRVELKHGDKSVWASVWVQPGQPDNTIAVHMGFGRTRSGRAGNGAGFNVYQIWTSDATTYASGVEVRDLHQKYSIATTQHHYLIDREHGPQKNAAHQAFPGEADFETAEASLRGVIRSVTIDEFKKNPDSVAELGEQPPKGLTIYPDVWKYKGYAWAMAIDLTACTGCGACVAACQAENNIAVVGKTQVLNTREMHWIRVDRYWEGSVENPTAHFQPVPCMHCENAPCELVCPVAATVHDQEGINTMVYNRCVGTRYCSNNCPYKVRRFNFFLYSDYVTESTKLQKNPDVSVRSRGVMEKCTYCTQRIQYAKIMSEREERAIRDGEIVTACEAACPTQAIVFGDQNDPNSRVTKWKKTDLNYGMLADLNTRPRTTYLAELRNPNPEISALDKKS
jgi:MoCo/4Fe-4S cofactor protein with predicted Tat translocation signal